MTASQAMSAQLTEQDDSITDDLSEILGGLCQPEKVLSPKFFYDEHGSRLFEQICELDEYYPTRTELSIMSRHVDEIAALVGPRASVIEFGSGASQKTRILLERLQKPAVYVPVDISRDHLVSVASELAAEYPHIEILPVAADFTQPFPLPNPEIMPLRNLVYFPGSTIGNFEPAAAADLLQVMHHEAGENGALLIGVDLQKDPEVLIRAYNDSQGVTARFNLNVLNRINRDFGADFEVDAFRHQAIYNDDLGRIEMRLISQKIQSVNIAGQVFRFEADEFITTEYSHKYTQPQFERMAEAAGFTVEKTWTDEQQWFSVQYCTRL